MGELTDTPDTSNVNVTLDEQNPLLEELGGKDFPCPVCGVGLPFRFSRKGKPYCVCDPCGIQLFFRGKRGIARLRDLMKSDVLITGKNNSASSAIALYNRLQQLKMQKEELEGKQGLVFRDEDLDHAIETVAGEIETVQAELEKMARKVRKDKKK